MRAVAWLGILGWIVGAALPGRAAESSTAPDVDALLRRLVARAHTVGADVQSPTLRYDKRSLYETLAPDGSIKRTKEKIYRVTLRRGMTFNQLVEVDGRTLPEAESQALSEKENKWRETYAGNGQGAATDRVDVLINEDLIARFDFTYQGLEPIRGRPAHRLAFQPKPGPLPSERLMDRVINLLHGTLWIDAADEEIAQATARTEGTLRLWGGILGSLESFDLHVDRERSAFGPWYLRQTDVTVRARRLFTMIYLRVREIGSGVRLAPNP